LNTVPDASQVDSERDSLRPGDWLPSNIAHLSHWLSALDRRTTDDNTETVELHPVLARFKATIESDPEIYMLFHLMFDQVPGKPPYDKTPNLKPQVRDYRHMLLLMNHILTHGPEFLVIDDEPAGLIGFPINAILDWPMGTAAGFAAFVHPVVNKHLREVLDAWGKFLSSAESTRVLNDSAAGWFGPAARKALPDFVELFECEPDKPHFGYKSWDDFFTRKYRPGVRPVINAEDDCVINNACESKRYKLAQNVKKFDQFWLKSQPYSLFHMLDGDSRVDEFCGGTVYQAYLSALAYHRWHSPVNGRVVSSRIVEGTYYSEAYNQGFANDGKPDDSGPNNSQGYLTSVATRALIFIECDNPEIGLICFIAVGMAEVSSCEITVEDGQVIKKGEQLGMFHFGGSTHCLLFGKNVSLDFIDSSPEDGNLPVNAVLARLK